MEIVVGLFLSVLIVGLVIGGLILVGVEVPSDGLRRRYHYETRVPSRDARWESQGSFFLLKNATAFCSEVYYFQQSRVVDSRTGRVVAELTSGRDREPPKRYSKFQ